MHTCRASTPTVTGVGGVPEAEVVIRVKKGVYYIDEKRKGGQTERDDASIIVCHIVFCSSSACCPRHAHHHHLTGCGRRPSWR